MNISTELISPAKAAEYLATSRGNIRPLKESKVRNLITEIERGEWRLSHQGIAFDVDGHLIDGHHRLTAISRQPFDVTVMVARGVSIDALPKVDCGLTRPMSVRARVTQHQAAVASLALQLLHSDRHSFTTGQVSGFASSKFGKTVALFEAHRTNRKGLDNAAITLGSVAAWFVSGDVAINQYVCMMDGEITKLRPGPARLVSMCMSGALQHVTHRKQGMAARAFHSFSEPDADVRNISDKMRAELVDRIRDIVKANLQPA